MELPRASVVDELESDRELRFGETLGQPREGIGLDHRPERQLVVGGVARGLADLGPTELTVAGDLEDDLGLTTLDGPALPAFLDLAVHCLDVPRVWKVGYRQCHGPGPLG